MKLLPIAILSAVLLVPAAAQTGPWTDGEFIVRSSNALGAPTLYRVVPETGATAALITPLYFGGWAGSTAFDAFRGGVLANVSLPPDGTFTFRLWLIAPDGSAAALPGFTGSLRALASTGDGRVFFIRHLSGGQGPKPVEYFDATDQIHTLLAADGVTPFQIEVEHLLYDAPTNSLIGASSNWWSATDCAPAGDSLYRIPLSADGTQVAGPVTCTSTSDWGANEEVMGLDHLPDGRVLVTIASGSPFYPYDKLRALDPASLSLTDWAHPIAGDINGGLWSARLGRAVIHTAPAELYTFGAGETGLGSLLPTSQPLPAGGGYSPDEILSEVDVNGPACDGFQLSYGKGLGGKGGFVPLLGAIGCPDIGHVFTLSINDVVGGASGMLFVGLAPASVPFKGGTFLVGGVAAQIAIAVNGAPGVAGAGSLALPAVLSSPVLSGVNIDMQAGFSDAAAVKGVSLSNGLQLQGD